MENEGSRIDLSETYHPLSSAKATEGAKQLRPQARAYAPRPSIHFQPTVSIEKAEEVQAQDKLPNNGSRWLPWSDWSECVNGEKIRYRSCIPNANMNCVGMKIEKQPCSVAEPVEIPFASDPWAIEREITLEGIERPSEA
uniref:DUF4749 domain-containing protein n=1 Tax=Syphacia muris TaxID=451379 RepID=A0A0N5AUC4_9BILA